MDALGLMYSLGVAMGTLLGALGTHLVTDFIRHMNGGQQ